VKLISLALITLTLVQAQNAAPQSAAAQAWAEAAAAVKNGNRGEAEKFFEKAIEAAIAEKNLQIEADARLELGRSLGTRGQYEPAEKHLTTALGLYEQLKAMPRVASARSALGLVAWSMGRMPDARRHYQEALSIYISTGDRRNEASSYYNLCFVTGGEERIDYIKRGLSVAHETGARVLEAQLLHI